MPIEILPENWPDWVQFDSTDGIGFLAEDPFWQAKAGSSDPEQAILYRGGVGFLDISSDGGKTWAPIGLPDTIPWFEPDENGIYDSYGFEPMPKPDPGIQKPRPNFLTYHSYAGNPAHSGEHAVLCSYHVDDGVAAGDDLDAMWIVYTFNDWLITGWTQLVNKSERSLAGITEGDYVEWKDLDAIDTVTGGPYAVTLGTDNKYAALARYYDDSEGNSKIRASKLSSSGVTLTVDGSIDHGNTYLSRYLYTYGDRVFLGQVTDHLVYTPKASYKWSLNVNPPPASGYIRLSDPIWGFAHEMYLSDTDRDGNDVDSILDQAKLGDYLRISSDVDDHYVIYWIGITTDQGAYHQYGQSGGGGLGLVWQASSGGDNFDEGENVTFELGIQRARVHVYEWDFSGANPVYIGSKTSDDIEDGLDVTGNNFNLAGTSRTFMMTDGGRLAFVISAWSGSQRRTFFMYYDVVGDEFSEPFLRYTGTDAFGVPAGPGLSGLSVSGGDDAIVLENYELSGDKHYLTAYFMNIGGWYIYDTIEIYNDHYAPGQDYTVLERCCALTSQNRFVFNARNAGTRLIKYNPAYLRFVELYEKPQYDSGESHYQAFAIRDDNPFLNDRIMWVDLDTGSSDNMSYSDYDLFPHKMEPWSEDWSGISCGYGDSKHYIRVYKADAGGGDWRLRAITAIVGDMPASDWFWSRLFVGQMGWGADGAFLYIPVADMDTFSTTYGTYTDKLERIINVPSGWTVGYQNEFELGWQFWSWDTLASESDVLNRITSVNHSPWPYETDGIIVWGLLFAIGNPTRPEQIQIWSTATNYDFVWRGSGFTDPVRAVVYYNERIYAALFTSTGIELWESDLPPYGSGGDYMNHMSDCPLDDCGFSAMDVDLRDGTMVLANKIADLLMVFASPTPYTTWYNMTLSHRNDRGVTGLVVL